jgi:hypothetical protein
MRQKNHTAPAYYILSGLLAILMVTFTITSCQKNSGKELSSNGSPVKDEMQLATGILEGQLNWGKLENKGSEENIVYLDFNNGNKHIFVQLSPENKSIEIPSLENASIITSHHGIIIKNPLTNKVFLFPKNDTESMRIFESIASVFKEKAGITPIAGTILLNFNS